MNCIGGSLNFFKIVLIQYISITIPSPSIPSVSPQYPLLLCFPTEKSSPCSPCYMS